MLNQRNSSAFGILLAFTLATWLIVQTTSQQAMDVII